MVEKTFKESVLPDLVPAALPVRCCGHCFYGVPIADPATLTQKIQCRAGPPSASFFPMQQGRQTGIALKSGWPILAPAEWCHHFRPAGGNLGPVAGS